MTVFLARHGETTGNRRGLILGQRDYPLIPSGMDVSKKLAAHIPAKNRGIILSSPLGRAVATAGIFSEITGWQITTHDGMTEISCGQWEGKTRKKVAPDKPSIRVTWTDFPPGGESYQDAEFRVRAVVDKIKAIDNCGQILVVGHASVNRVFLKLWLDMASNEATRITQPHDLVYVLGKDKDVFWINAAGQKGQGLL